MRNPLRGNKSARFYRSISTMVSAGIPLHRCLEHLAEYEESAEVKELLEHLATKLLSGSTFSNALRTRYRAFGPLTISMIELAEMSGSLYIVLRKLAEYEERNLKLRNKLKSQLTYPLFLGSFALLALIFLPGFCLEGIFEMLQTQGAELPPLSMLFWELSRATHNGFFWIAVAAVITGLSVSGYKLWESGNGRGVMFAALEQFPPTRKVLVAWKMSVLSDCLALQLEAGVSPLKAMPLAGQATGDPRAVEASEMVVGAMTDGETITDSLRHWPDLPLLFVSMARSGEESGRWPHLLRKLSQFYADELENALERLVTLLEPLTLCVMGLVFGLIIVATMTPMIQLIQELG